MRRRVYLLLIGLLLVGVPASRGPLAFDAPSQLWSSTSPRMSSQREIRIISGYAHVEGGQLTLEVASCRDDLAATYTAASDAVEVRITTRDPENILDCAALVQIVLDEPLGDRHVVDSSTGHVVEIQLVS